MIAGRLTVIQMRRQSNKHGKRLFLCRCSCGDIKETTGSKLRRGKIQSCGKVGCRIGTSHGLSKTSKAYIRWKTMLARCLNQRSEDFHIYGARGITVCERWHTFENFLADMGEPPHATVLDRVDNEKGYSPSNCRWASFKQSTQNRRNTLWIGKSRVQEVAVLLGIPEQRIYQRISKMGWTLADIMKHPGPIPHGYHRTSLRVVNQQRARELPCQPAAKGERIEV